MDTLILDSNKRYTYADYLTWFDEKRRELYEGFINLMSAPTRKHQNISVKITSKLFSFLENKKCKVYSAPFDVRLPVNGETANGKIHTVVQPDIVVVCDPNKLDDKGCIGAPNLVVEILSPSTTKNDLKDKYFLYEKAGVLEYWIAYPSNNTINKFVLNLENKFQLEGMYVEGDKISPTLFPDLVLDITNIFEM